MAVGQRRCGAADGGARWRVTDVTGVTGRHMPPFIGAGQDQGRDAGTRRAIEVSRPPFIPWQSRRRRGTQRRWTRSGRGTNGTMERRSRVMDLRASAAVLAARLAGGASRLLRRGGGTALPGLVAERIAPRLLEQLAGALPQGAVVVTGTNGKTTTAHMLGAVLARAGFQPLRNATGSNLARGVATALAAHASWLGRLDVPERTIGVFETDEAAFAGIVPAVRPRVAVMTNLFRDQLDRYGEVDTVAALWRSTIWGLAAASATTRMTLVLNADDPTVAALGLANGQLGEHGQLGQHGQDMAVAPSPSSGRAGPRSGAPAPAVGDGGRAGWPAAVYFGIEDARWGHAGLEHAADAKVCPRCGLLLKYPLCFYGHLGHYACAAGHERPRPAVYVRRLEPAGFDGTDLVLVTPGGETSLRLPVPGLYNVYNALAAAAAAWALGLSLEAITAGLASFRAAFGRFERATVEGREVVLILAKNPVGMNEVLRTLFADGRPKHLLLALNDLDADGRDVSWIWDADFERLAGQALSLTVAGRRAEDLAVRLKYAGALAATGGGPAICPDLAGALDLALERTPPGDTLHAVLTYTAMLELRRLLSDRGYLRAYWEAP
jgi:UDP-N-acetylmuramyl tripeptide synthase